MSSTPQVADPPIYFNAGPGPFPTSVLQQAQSSLLQLDSHSPSILTLSHRSKQFETILNDSEALLRKLLHLPSTHTCVWIQGGATLQFAMVPLHFLHRQTTPVHAQYYITGTWSQKAMQEATKLGVTVDCLSMPSSSSTEQQQQQQQQEKERKSPHEITYTYFCSNETVDGIEWEGPEQFQGKLVADMSSNFLSKPIPNIAKFDVIFAGAQKNVGPAGVTLVILKTDLVAPHVTRPLPLLLDYATFVASRSLYNTPPVFAMYVCYLMLMWLNDLGGLDKMAQLNHGKSHLLYTFLDHAKHMWSIPQHHRSQMNIVFRIGNKASLVPDTAIEHRFVQVAEKHGFHGLEGHRSVGGLRASLYNAITLDQVQKLVDFIRWFDENEIQKQESSTK